MEDCSSLLVPEEKLRGKQSVHGWHLNTSSTYKLIMQGRIVLKAQACLCWRFAAFARSQIRATAASVLLAMHRHIPCTCDHWGCRSSPWDCRCKRR